MIHLNFTPFFYAQKQKRGGAYDCVIPLPSEKTQNRRNTVKHFFAKAKAVLEDKGGEGYVDTAVKMIIAVVIGSLLLGGLYFIFNSVILPGLAERIQDMFS